jgi:HD-GYP domain-containing protein (c-di-GMP phosphodiesterase class II)
MAVTNAMAGLIEPGAMHAAYWTILSSVHFEIAAPVGIPTLFAVAHRLRAERDRVLEEAYDTTLEGWARALEFRDRETEGHTRRVAELTVRLGLALGGRGRELIHLRRGALLHDIGKMAVPDSILLKAGPLTPEEWEVMREHPDHARRMLEPVEFLRPALDIPYCHHERWNGSGYPRGLSREEIPLAARLFAVVDVWDALGSERPYREAWTRERVEAHLRDGAGVLFDPRAVEVFLDRVIGPDDTARATPRAEPPP